MNLLTARGSAWSRPTVKALVAIGLGFGIASVLTSCGDAAAGDELVLSTVAPNGTISTASWNSDDGCYRFRVGEERFSECMPANPTRPRIALFEVPQVEGWVTFGTVPDSVCGAEPRDRETDASLTITRGPDDTGVILALFPSSGLTGPIDFLDCETGFLEP